MTINQMLKKVDGMTLSKAVSYLRGALVVPGKPENVRRLTEAYEEKKALLAVERG